MNGNLLRQYIEQLTETISFTMILIEGGRHSFPVEKEEKERKEITIPSFYMGEVPVTQELWKAVMGGDNPSQFIGDNRPIETVSWHDCHEFLKRLNGFSKLSRHSYRLPSEAEWEYAACGGELSRGFRYAGSDKLDEVGWFGGNSYGETKPVGLKLPNELGFHDMSGNVWEWCEDDYSSLEGVNLRQLPADGSALVGPPDRGEFRVLRGGGYFDGEFGCHCAGRLRIRPEFSNGHYGFRLAVSVSG